MTAIRESDGWLDRNVYLRPIATCSQRLLIRRACVIGAYLCWAILVVLLSLPRPAPDRLLTAILVSSLALLAVGSWVKGGLKDREAAILWVGIMFACGLVYGLKLHAWAMTQLNADYGRPLLRETVWAVVFGVPLAAVYYSGRTAILSRARRQALAALDEAEELAGKKHWADARDRYEAALTVAPDLEEAQYGLAVCWQKLGNQRKAREEYWRYLRHHRRGRFSRQARAALIGMQTQARRRKRSTPGRKRRRSR